MMLLQSNSNRETCRCGLNNTSSALDGHTGRAYSVFGLCVADNQTGIAGSIKIAFFASFNLEPLHIFGIITWN